MTVSLSTAGVVASSCSMILASSSMSLTPLAMNSSTRSVAGHAKVGKALGPPTMLSAEAASLLKGLLKSIGLTWSYSAKCLPAVPESTGFLCTNPEATRVDLALSSCAFSKLTSRFAEMSWCSWLSSSIISWMDVLLSSFKILEINIKFFTNLQSLQIMLTVSSK